MNKLISDKLIKNFLALATEIIANKFNKNPTFNLNSSVLGIF